MSPTQRSLALLRSEGWVCQVTEYTVRIPGRTFKRDLWGIVDILCLRDGEILGVQTTSGSNLSARMQKVADCEHLPQIRRANIKLECHGWRKLKAGWACKREDVS